MKKKKKKKNKKQKPWAQYLFSKRKWQFCGIQVIKWLLLIAGIVSFKFKDFYAAVEDLSTCVKLDKNNTSAYTYLVSIQDLNLAVIA
jgi:hypothetical protein